MKNILIQFSQDINLPSSISERGLINLVKLCKDTDSNKYLSGYIKASSGTISESIYLILHKNNVEVVDTTIIEDEFEIYTENSLISEGSEEKILVRNTSSTGLGMDREVLTWKIKSISVISSLLSEDLIKERIHISDTGILYVDSPLENYAWEASVVVEAVPLESTLPGKTCLVTVLAVSISTIKLEVADTNLSEGLTTRVYAVPVPSKATKPIPKISLTCEYGTIFSESGLYTAPYLQNEDTITAKCTIYNNDIIVQLKVNILVILMNDTDKYPEEFAAIKTAMEWDDTKHSLISSDIENMTQKLFNIYMNTRTTTVDLFWLLYLKLLELTLWSEPEFQPNVSNLITGEALIDLILIAPTSPNYKSIINLDTSKSNLRLNLMRQALSWVTHVNINTLNAEGINIIGYKNSSQIYTPSTSNNSIIITNLINVKPTLQIYDSIVLVNCSLDDFDCIGHIKTSATKAVFYKNRRYAYSTNLLMLVDKNGIETPIPENTILLYRCTFHTCSLLSIIPNLPSTLLSVLDSALYGTSINKLNARLCKSIAFTGHYSYSFAYFVLPETSYVYQLLTSMLSRISTFYVPDNLVDSYKESASYSAYADRIFGYSLLAIDYPNDTL